MEDHIQNTEDHPTSQAFFPQWAAKALAARHMSSRQVIGRIVFGKVHPNERKDLRMILE